MKTSYKPKPIIKALRKLTANALTNYTIKRIGKIFKLSNRLNFQTDASQSTKSFWQENACYIQNNARPRMEHDL